MDVVYPVKLTADNNSELRWSLRTVAAHLPHRRVWVVGERPSWVDDVSHIPDGTDGSKYRSTTRRLIAAAEHPDVSDPFWYFNDDHFLLQDHPDGIVPYHRGPMADRLRDVRRHTPNAPWSQGLSRTLSLLRTVWAVESPLSFETHTPLRIHKESFLRAVTDPRTEAIRVLHKRSLHGNTEPALTDAAVLMEGDVKLDSPRSRLDPAWGLTSTTDVAWEKHPAAALIRRRYPHPSRYER